MSFCCCCCCCCCCRRPNLLKNGEAFASCMNGAFVPRGPANCWRSETLTVRASKSVQGAAFRFSFEEGGTDNT